jgi:hypothetical protein
MALMATNIMDLAKYGQQQFQIGQEQGRERQLSKLSSGVISGDPQAYAQAAAIDPQRANQYQQAGDNIALRARGAAKFLQSAIQSGNPQYLTMARSTIKPFMDTMIPDGYRLDMDPNEELAGIEAFLAKTGHLEHSASGDAPTGYRQFEMMARAAGLQPGTPEYESAARVNLGIDGRASSAGFRPVSVTGSDGIERHGAFDGRTGRTDLSNGSSFTPGMAGGVVGDSNAFAGRPAEVQAALEAGAREAAQQGARLAYLPSELSQRTAAAIEQTAGQEAVRRQSELVANEPKRQQAVALATDTARNVISVIDKAAKQVSPWAAGGGGMLTAIPSTDSRDLAANIRTIKANLGFDRLQMMRDASPTGGALGQVAVQELDALQASVSSLDQLQSPAQLKANLDTVRKHYENWLETITQADREARARVRTQPNVAPVAPTRGGGVRRYNPATGRLE